MQATAQPGTPLSSGRARAADWTRQESKLLMDAITDPDPRVGLLQAQTRNMRSKCRCSCVLQFTLCHAFSSVLHRPPSQLIHCIVLYSILYAFTRKRFPRIQRLCSRGEKGSKVGTRPGHRAAAHRHPPGLASRGTDHRLAAPQQTGCRPASSRTRRGPGIPGGVIKVSRQQSLGL